MLPAASKIGSNNFPKNPAKKDFLYIFSFRTLSDLSKKFLRSKAIMALKLVNCSETPEVKSPRVADASRLFLSTRGEKTLVKTIRNKVKESRANPSLKFKYKMKLPTPTKITML